MSGRRRSLRARDHATISSISGYIGHTRSLTGAVRVQVLADRAFVVQRPRGIDAADPRRHRVVRGAVARLVAERPGDDAGVVAIAQHHARAALDHRGLVARVVAEARPARVGFEVGLVDHVEAEFVAEVVEALVVRVVRAAHRVHVMALHQLEIAAHAVERDGAAAHVVPLVAVHADDRHRLTVHQQLVVAHDDRAEAHALRHHLANGARRIAQRRDHAIQHGRLVRPRRDPAQRHRRARDVPREHVAVHQLEHRRAAPEDRHLDASRLRERPAARVAQLELDLPARFGRTREADAQLRIERRRAALAERRLQRQVGDPRRRRAGERNAAVQARQPPLVLVFEPRRVGPLHHRERDRVLARDEMRRDLELARQAAVLAHPDRHAVHPGVRRRSRPSRSSASRGGRSTRRESSKRRRKSPVGFCSGTAGGSVANGINTFV